jgi:hypothetical protein
MKHGFLITVASLGAIIVTTAMSPQASLAAQLKTLLINGNGSIIGNTTACTHSDNDLCPGSDSCLCNSSSGTAKTALAGLGGATFAATTVIDTSEAIGAGCESTQGTVTITSGNHKNSLVLNYVGSACLFTNPLEVITTSYAVDGTKSTGKFAGATGTGLITGSEDPVSGQILGTVSGNIIQQ